MGLFVNRCILFGIKHDLGQAFPVSEIDENDAAMITSSLYPTHQHNFLAHIVYTQLPTIMGPSHFT